MVAETSSIESSISCHIRILTTPTHLVVSQLAPAHLGALLAVALAIPGPAVRVPVLPVLVGKVVVREIALHTHKHEERSDQDSDELERVYVLRV